MRKYFETETSNLMDFLVLNLDVTSQKIEPRGQ